MTPTTYDQIKDLLDELSIQFKPPINTKSGEPNHHRIELTPDGGGIRVWIYLDNDTMRSIDCDTLDGVDPFEYPALFATQIADLLRKPAKI